MRVLRINKATDLVENAELWEDLPDETAGYCFLASDTGGSGWSYTGGVLTLPVEAVSLEDLRADKRKAVLAEYTRRVNIGFPLPGGDLLQVRDGDKANWLTLKDVCDDAIEAGAGAQACVMPPRTTSNAYVPGTYAETKALLQSMRTWAGAMMGRLFALKDTVAAAKTQAALDAIDVTSGWP